MIDKQCAILNEHRTEFHAKVPLSLIAAIRFFRWEIMTIYQLRANLIVRISRQKYIER